MRHKAEIAQKEGVRMDIRTGVFSLNYGTKTPLYMGVFGCISASGEFCCFFDETEMLEFHQVFRDV